MSIYFSDKELNCKCGKCGKHKMDKKFMAKLDSLRGILGEPLKLSSAYRCPEYNAQVSKTGETGPHTTGKAVDVLCSGKLAYKVIGLATAMHFNGIGVSQKGLHEDRFIHVDDINNDLRPWCWSY